MVCNFENASQCQLRNYHVFTSFHKKQNKAVNAVHRGAIFQFPFRWIYYYGSNKSTGKETGKTHLCALGRKQGL